MIDPGDEPPRAYTPQPVRTGVTALSLAEAEAKQRAYADRRRMWVAPWHGSAGRTWPAAVRSTAGRQVHDPRQKRLLWFRGRQTICTKLHAKPLMWEVVRDYLPPSEETCRAKLARLTPQ